MTSFLIYTSAVNSASNVDQVKHLDNTANNFSKSGSEKKWEIKGFNGNDTLEGGKKKDWIYGGVGSDRLYGSRGNDKLFGQDGNDILYGENDDDNLFGGLKNDTLYGGSGNDGLNGNQNDDVLYGGNGDDVLYGGDGDDVLYGGDNSDILYGGDGFDTLTGGNGHDIFLVEANSGFDIITDFVQGKDLIGFIDMDYNDVSFSYGSNTEGNYTDIIYNQNIVAKVYTDNPNTVLTGYFGAEIIYS